MDRRSLRLAPLVAAALLIAAPVAAQDPGAAVAYAGVGFTLAPELGASIAIVPVAAVPDGTSPIANPAHTSFAFSNVTQNQARIPATWGAPGTLSVYATADIAGHDWAEQQLAALQALLADRPDLATYETGAADATWLPYIDGGDAAQIVRARAHYLDTPQLSGVAYVAAFGQDIYRMGASDFWYVFQGLSVDGSQYVSIAWTLTAPGFPAQSGFDPKDQKAAHYAAYLQTVIDKLDAADPEAFSPSLTQLDALAQSVTFEGIPAREPGPLAPPLPSASPAA